MEKLHLKQDLTQMSNKKKRASNNAMIYQTPWAIRQADFTAMLDRLLSKTDGMDEMFGLVEEDAELDYEIEDGVAVLEISGVIGNKLPVWMQKYLGMTSADRIAEAIERADADLSVSALVLSIDSPGGTVSGVPEIGQRIAAMSKPVVAFTDNLMASAAYWIGSQATAIVATKSAIVGSIGVYLPAISYKKMYENAGVSVDLIKAGKYKGALYPGTDLTEEQRDDLQDGVDYVYRLFSGAVAERREVDPEVMQGQDFYADDAVANGLIDQLGTLDDAIEIASTLSKTGQNNQD
jgi:signal peptide peptidase SppA